jgi:hypothetical protein
MKSILMVLFSVVAILAANPPTLAAESTCMTDDLLIVPECNSPRKALSPRTVGKNAASRSLESHSTSSKKVVASANTNSVARPFVQAN